MIFAFNLLLCGLLCSQALFLGVFGVSQLGRSRAAQPLVGLSAAFVAYALTPLAATLGPNLPLQLTMFFESLVPVFFWYLAETLFEDDFAWSRIHILGAVAALVSVANVVTLSFPGPTATQVSTVCVQALRLLHTVFIVLGLRSALLGWSDDVVAARLRIRFAVEVASGGGLLGLILARYYRVEARGLDQVFPLWLNSVVFGLLLGANTFLAFHKDLLMPWKPPRLRGVTPEAAPADAQLERKLAEAMEIKEAFKSEGSTIAQLAVDLKVPEYRLRAHVNGTLGYRNFSQFLSHHRIELAKRMLADQRYRNEKILTVALEVGFGSLAPFNRTFKERTGRTPSEFRQESLLDS